MFLFIIIPYFILLPNDNPLADVVDIGITMDPITVKDNVIELDVVAKLTKASIDFNNVVIDLYFLYFFVDLLFLSLKYVIISLMLLIWLLKLSTSFHLFSNRCSKSIFSNGAFGYNVSRFASFLWYKLDKFT